jgi:hypothetical protein
MTEAVQVQVTTHGDSRELLLLALATILAMLARAQSHLAGALVP